MRDRRERAPLPHDPMGVFYKNTRKAHCSVCALQIIIWLRCTRQVKQKHSLGKKGEDVPFYGPSCQHQEEHCSSRLVCGVSRACITPFQGVLGGHPKGNSMGGWPTVRLAVSWRKMVEDKEPDKTSPERGMRSGMGSHCMWGLQC